MGKDRCSYVLSGKKWGKRDVLMVLVVRTRERQGITDVLIFSMVRNGETHTWYVLTWYLVCSKVVRNDFLMLSMVRNWERRMFLCS